MNDNKGTTGASTDRLGVTIAVGDTVLYASTSKSAGVSWHLHKVIRVTDKRFYYQGTYGEVWGKCANALVVLPKAKKLVAGDIDDLLRI